MSTPETPQKFPTPEEARQNLEKSFNERMNRWQEALAELESIQRPLSGVEKIAIEGLQQEIKFLPKPYESDEKKASLGELLAKIDRILKKETV